MHDRYGGSRGGLQDLMRVAAMRPFDRPTTDFAMCGFVLCGFVLRGFAVQCETLASAITRRAMLNFLRLAVALGCMMVLAGGAAAQFATESSTSGRPSRAPSTPKAKPPADGTSHPLRSTASMQVTLVRSNQPGCEPNCAEWIAADGTIDEHSVRRMKQALARLGGRKLPVFINSPGGSVDDAIVLAGLVRSRGLDVIVARTELHACGPQDQTCKALRKGAVRLGTPAGLARCASSCPFVLAGGVRRMAGEGAYVGVHRAATYKVMTRVMRTYRLVPRYEWGIPVGTTRKLIAEKPVSQSFKPAETTPDTYERIERNFVAMGVSNEIMRPMLATPNSDMRWLTPVEAAQFRLVNERVNGRQLVAAMQRSLRGPEVVQAPTGQSPPLGGALAAPPLASIAGTHRPEARVEEPGDTGDLQQSWAAQDPAMPSFGFGLPIAMPAIGTGPALAR